MRFLLGLSVPSSFLSSVGVLGWRMGLLWPSLSLSVQQSPLRETGPSEVRSVSVLSERMRADLVINGSDGDIWGSS